MPNVARLLTRLSQMSWDELRVRAGQEAGKRLDVVRYKAGQPHFDICPTGTVVRGKFFFSENELPERVRLLQQHLPSAVEAIVGEADLILRHRFHLLGYNNLDYGQQINWHLDAAHGRQTPLIPWFKIDFLNPEIAGDHKVTWELNRHQHLVTLAKAWLLTGEAQYAAEAIEQWYSWQRSNPYPLGVNWASSLEVAFRALSWLWMGHLLSGFPSLPATFADDYLRALALSGRHIERYLSTYFSPNTHLLGEAVALFFIGTLYPDIRASARWKAQGWTIIQQEIERQVRPDGIYFEQSLHYHVYAFDFFLHARLLAARNGIEVPADYDAALRRMLHVIQALAQAGPPDGFGDDDGGRLFNPRRNRPEFMTDPLALGAALFPDRGFATGLTEEAIWLFGPQASAACSDAEPKNRPIASQGFPEGGLYIAADNAPFAQQMVIDAGPQGIGRSGHGHADALSIKLSFAGRPWLVDSGTCVYIIPPEDRVAFRGTHAHNTLAIDGLDQAEQAGPFAWNSLPVTKAESWIAAEHFTFFAGSHSGYERLEQPVRHRRFIFHLHGDFWLVRDVADGAGEHLLETSWHFAPDLQMADDEKGFVGRDPENAYSLTLLPVHDPQWQCGLSTGHVSPAYGKKLPAPVLRCAARIRTPAEHCVLLIPSREPYKTPGKFRRKDLPQNSEAPAAVYGYENSSLSHSLIFGHSSSAEWSFGPWSSDAKFLYFCARDHQLIHWICCEATALSFRGNRVFSSAAKLQYMEWRNQAGERRLGSSDIPSAKAVTKDMFEGSMQD